MSENNNNNSNNEQHYPYDQYHNYYYQQYYANAPPQPPIPQGDPSAALSTMVYQLQQQTQQRQAMGALAAASISSVLGNNKQQPPVEYYADYYAVNDQRSVINYDDLSLPNNQSTVTEAKAVTDQPEISPKKPKFCCNRWLKSAIAVAQHEKLHIKCPSCEHMCLQSALQEHEENFHGKEKKVNDKKPSRPDGVIPPNAPRIETPEELDAWIAARKKNWPSKVNVERKEQEEAEKEARGELPMNKKRKPNNKREPIKKQKVAENTLIAQYDSDSDDAMDIEKDAVSSKDPSSMGKILLPEDRPKRRCKYFMSGNCKRGDECGFSHEKPEPKPKQPKQPKAAPTFKKRPNLLYKLLEKEILQEKSVILQCLRYIVDNNFFGKGNQPTQDQIMSSQKPEESKPEDHILESSETENTITETPMTHDLTVEDHKIESPKIDNHVAEAHTEDCTSALKKLPTEHLNLDSSATSSINQDAKMQESAQEERRLSKPESENINKAESIEPATKPTDLPVNTLDMAHSGPEIASDDKCLP